MTRVKDILSIQITSYERSSMPNLPENLNRSDRDPVDLKVRFTVAAVVIIGVIATFVLFSFLTGRGIT
jgi:hypothetical protein